MARKSNFPRQAISKAQTTESLGDVVQQLFEEANTRFWNDTTDGVAKAALRDASAMVSTANRLNGALRMAQGRESMMVAPGKLDSREHLLGVKNGVVCLKDGTFRAGVWRDFITKQAGADWIEEAQCPTWLNFLRETFNGDQELIDWLQVFQNQRQREQNDHTGHKTKGRKLERYWLNIIRWEFSLFSCRRSKSYSSY